MDRWIADYRVSPFANDGDLFLAVRSADGSKLDVVESITMKRVEAHSIFEPSLRANSAPSTNHDFLQAVLDCAWEQGLRPNGYDASEKREAAMGRHLEDMRALAFHYTKAEKP